MLGKVDGRNRQRQSFIWIVGLHHATSTMQVNTCQNIDTF